jgi:hypothetical protein
MVALLSNFAVPARIVSVVHRAALAVDHEMRGLE